MDSINEKHEMLIESIMDIIERKGTTRNKAEEIVTGILYPAVKDVVSHVGYLEHMSIGSPN